jgi:uncharacterized protein (TIGR00299 family) protein
MSKLVYFDCYSGISGDMVLGALLDAGLPLAELKRALGSLPVDGCEVSAEKVLRAGVAATKFCVGDGPDGSTVSSHEPHVHAHERAHGHIHGGGGGERAHSHAHSHAEGLEHTPAHEPGHVHEHRHAHQSLPEILSVIERSALSVRGKARVRSMFTRLAEAEAAIHRMPVERVLLHEVGALDSIVDIVGAVFGMEWLNADRVVSSPLNVGGGMVQTAHGLFPVPAPATVSLLRGVPVYSRGPQVELVTPTGALIVTEFASEFGALPPMTVDSVGYGAGARDPAETPNVLRLLIGEERMEARGERVVMLTCEIDDMNPQIFGVLMDRLYEAGAVEVFFSPVQMKKNRPGTLVSVIGRPSRRPALADVLFAETTTIGVRVQEIERECLEREMRAVATPLGPVRFKIARRGGAVVNASPEFDDCVALATAHALPVKDVQAIALRAYLDSQ